MKTQSGIWGSNKCALTYDYVKSHTEYASENRTYARVINQKQYELTDHLGNVLATVSDLKEYVLANDRFEADVVSCQDYFPFGMLMTNRKEDFTKFRYGYQGQEMDNEIKGDGNSLEFKFRIYDSRLGRFLSIDPLSPEYPWNSNYAFAENDVIRCIDLEGAEKLNTNQVQANSVHFSNANYDILVNSFTKTNGRIYNQSNENTITLGTTGNTIQWNVYYAGNFKDQGKPLLVLLEGTPSQALNDLYSNIMNYSLDCGEYANIVELYSVLQKYGAKKFDRKFRTKEGYLFYLSPTWSPGYGKATEYGSVRSHFRNEEYKQSYFSTDEERQAALSDLQKAPIGSRIVMVIGRSENAEDGYINENVIKVGDDLYSAYGVGNNLTWDELNNRLQTYGVKEGSSDRYYIYQIIKPRRPNARRVKKALNKASDSHGNPKL